MKGLNKKLIQVGNDEFKDSHFNLGIPRGSISSEERGGWSNEEARIFQGRFGGLKSLLMEGKIYIKYVGENTPLEAVNIPWLNAINGRPQSMPFLTHNNDGIDAFFCGDDWVKENSFSGIDNRKLLELKMGTVSIVYGTPKIDVEPKIKRDFKAVVTEYPNIAVDFLSRKTGENISIYPIDKLTSARIKPKGEYAVFQSPGATEALVRDGWADCLVELTQSGSSFRNYGIKVQETIMTSQTSLFYSPRIEKDLWKMEKLKRIEMMLKGAVRAIGQEAIIFNVGNSDYKQVMDYVMRNKLFADEPTTKKDQKNTEFTLLIPTMDMGRPYIDVIGDLKLLGAKSIYNIRPDFVIK